MKAKSRDILVAAPERWDEACFSVPAVRALLASGLGVGVVCQMAQGKFWETIPRLNVFACPDGLSAKKAALALGEGWKLGCVWEKNFAAEVISKVGLTRVIGPAVPELSRYVSHPMPLELMPEEHRVRFYLSLIEGLGVCTDEPEFFKPVSRVLETKKGVVLVLPESPAGESYEWEIERWEPLVEEALRRGWRVDVGVIKKGKGLAKALVQRMAGKVSAVELTGVREALSELAAYRRVMAADSEWPHVAAHFGAKCLVLFGPNDPRWKRPLGRQHVIASKKVECGPCLLPRCRMDRRCQKELTVEMVLEWMTQKQYWSEDTV